MKRCSNCRKEKPATDYYKDKRNIDGLHSQCKLCHKAGCRKKYHYIPALPEPKSYIDYLKEQGQYDYYRRTLRYQ